MKIVIGKSAIYGSKAVCELIIDYEENRLLLQLNGHYLLVAEKDEIVEDKLSKVAKNFTTDDHMAIEKAIYELNFEREPFHKYRNIIMKLKAKR